MRANREEPESAPNWFQSLSGRGRPHGGLLHTRAQTRPGFEQDQQGKV